VSLLEVDGAAKSFGGIQALSGTTVSVEEGEIVGIIGPNGSGKTTLFNVITGYERVDAGDIRILGRRTRRYSPGRVFRLGLGRTFQLTRVFPRLTVVENMHVASQRAGAMAALRPWSLGHEHARAMDLLDFVGLSHLRDLEAGSLSYGQKKLLEFGSLLMARPKAILLDEPAGGVNPTMVGLIAGHINALNRDEGITFLIVEHNMEFVMNLCRRVAVMHRGAVISEGDPETVRRDPAVLEAYLGD
jgi:ABC-type branched-subunit amino acid transport system ATPase component